MSSWDQASREKRAVIAHYKADARRNGWYGVVFGVLLGIAIASPFWMWAHQPSTAAPERIPVIDATQIEPLVQELRHIEADIQAMARKLGARQATDQHHSIMLQNLRCALMYSLDGYRYRSIVSALVWDALPNWGEWTDDKRCSICGYGYKCNLAEIP